MLYRCLAALLLAALAAVPAAAKWEPPPPRFTCPQRAILHYPCVCTAGGDLGIHLRCDNSNLAQLSAALRNVRVPLDSLTLSRCSISRLHGSLFHSVSARSLHIEHTPIRNIGADTFLGINNTLLNLTMWDTRLTEVPVEALSVLTNTSVLEIVGSDITYIPEDAFKDMVKLTDLTLRKSQISSFHQKAFAGLRRLKKISLAYNNLTSVPPNAFKFNLRLNNLDLAYNNFNKLNSKFFRDIRQMIWCNMSNNAITDMGRATFSRNGALGYLDMSHNKIPKIDSNEFRTMRSMRRLFFNDNNIKRIGRGAFKVLNKVGTIDIARNHIKKIDYQMFWELEYLEILNAQENEITEIEKNTFKDLYLTTVNISHNQLSQIADDAFINCNNMTFLDLSHNNLTELNEKAFDDNSDLTELRLEFNYLTNMSAPFDKFKLIRVLNMSYNSIVEIPKRTFPDLYELHTIDVSHNQIAKIGGGVFTTLFSLRHLDLSHNMLEELRASSIGTMPSLLDVNLSHNRLRTTTRSAFQGLSSLRELRLDHNHLESVVGIPQSLSVLYLSHNRIASIRPGRSWPTMNSLIELDLDSNLLADNLEGGAFENLRTVRLLHLRNNSMTLPPWQALSDMTTLQHLYLDDNRITTMGRGALGKLLVLFELTMRRNGLRDVAQRAFEGNAQLINLTLAENDIEFIPNEAFKGLVALNKIDLSHNRLSVMNNQTHGLFDDCLSLRKVNLSHNHVSQIHVKTFPYSKWIPYRLEELDLSSNKLAVIGRDFSTGLKDLKKLNLANNSLIETRQYVLGNLTKLEELDLSHNQLAHFPEDSIGPNPKMLKLKLNDNFLITLPVEAMSEMVNLTLLDVSNNRVRRFYDQLMPWIENGTQVFYQGNQLRCDCALRRLRSWMDDRTAEPDSPWASVACETPAEMRGQIVTELDVAALTCIGPEQDASVYQEKPDIVFRSVDGEEDGALRLSWYVNTREDVGDFVILARALNETRPSATEAVSYTERTARLAPLLAGQKYLVCVRALTSGGELRPHRDGQCRTVSPAAPVAAAPPLLVLVMVALVSLRLVNQ
ncbi:insulin-like growth factor-binding protein complex acid labile subunit [Amphibalanus amphitrite]|uniref:insulin-like growth factor-binding protein complex acid labile subunit n=1 Tax=Amphibalanus amphitrite TaxID=1232801 RepID=UPI001C9151A9|nr:insulin-like growth factor-binding protein complex acid labile subunit [Amphibalanus amphitrite]